MKLKLENGMNYGIDRFGNRVCTGAKMGRPNRLPGNKNNPIKLRLEKLQLVNGDYDKSGCYWGSPNNLWCAWATDYSVLIFMRGWNREEIKASIVTNFLSHARFYR